LEGRGPQGALKGGTRESSPTTTVIVWQFLGHKPNPGHLWEVKGKRKRLVDAIPGKSLTAFAHKGGPTWGTYGG